MINYFVSTQRIANVMAIEFCEIYLLDYASTKKYLQINDTIMQKLTASANYCMERTLAADEAYKQQMLEKTSRESLTDLDN